MSFKIVFILIVGVVSRMDAAILSTLPFTDLKINLIKLHLSRIDTFSISLIFSMISVIKKKLLQ